VEKRKYVRVFIGGISYITLNEVQKLGQILRKTCKNQSRPFTTVQETLVFSTGQLAQVNLRTAYKVHDLTRVAYKVCGLSHAA
jgi:hypothetical protein